MRTVAAIALCFAFAAPAAAQPITRCAACHLANLSRVAAIEHVGEWQRSPHAKAGVGCHECHGGNPWANEPAEAHRGVYGPSHPLSLVNRLNVPNTCARCHDRVARAYASTLHATLVSIDDGRAPLCTTCHGVMSARVPSPATLEARCAGCHPPGSARAAYPARMREALEALTKEQDRAASMQDAAERTTDAGARVALIASMMEVRNVLNAAVAAVHRLDPLDVAAEARLAHEKLDAIAAR